MRNVIGSLTLQSIDDGARHLFGSVVGSCDSFAKLADWVALCHEVMNGVGDVGAIKAAEQHLWGFELQ